MSSCLNPSLSHIGGESRRDLISRSDIVGQPSFVVRNLHPVPVFF